MNPDLNLLDEEFGTDARQRVRVRPGGLLVRETLFPTIRAVIASWSFVRRFFRDDRLICRSDDGEFAARGRACLGCPDRSACVPRIRLLLDACTVPGPARTAPSADLLPPALVLEIAYTSARNFAGYARSLALARGGLSDVPTLVAVLDRGHWGEVRFVPNPDPVQP